MVLRTLLVYINLKKIIQHVYFHFNSYVYIPIVQLNTYIKILQSQKNIGFSLRNPIAGDVLYLSPNELDILAFTSGSKLKTRHIV